MIEELSKVAIVTTSWDQVHEKTGKVQELKLSGLWDFRFRFGNGSSTMCRDDGTRAFALRVIRSLSSGERLKSLQIQRELVDETRLLDPPKAIQRELVDKARSLGSPAIQDYLRDFNDSRLTRHLSAELPPLSGSLPDRTHALKSLSISNMGTSMLLSSADQTQSSTKSLHDLPALIAQTSRHSSPDSIKSTEIIDPLISDHMWLRKGPDSILRASGSSGKSAYDLQNGLILRRSVEHSSQRRERRRYVGDAADGLKSNLARRQSGSRASSTTTPEHEAGTRNAENSPRQLRRRALHEERVAIRAEIHRTSLHALRSQLLQYASDGILGEQIYKELKTLEEDIGTPISGQSSGTVQSLYLEALYPKFPIDKELQDIRFDLRLRYILGTNTDLISHWLYSRLWLCRNLGIVVYRNCCRLQTAHLADDFLSFLVPADSWSHHGPCVVNLKRIQIVDIEALVNKLASCLRDICGRGPHIISGQPDIQLLVGCFQDIQARSRKLFASINPKDSSQSISAINLRREIANLYAGGHTQNSLLVSIFARCQDTFQALDLVLLAYEGAHVSDLDQLPHSSPTSI